MSLPKIRYSTRSLSSEQTVRSRESSGSQTNSVDAREMASYVSTSSGQTIRSINRLWALTRAHKARAINVTRLSYDMLLRATSVVDIMHDFSAIFSNSCGNAKTFALSKEVNAIDCFISHNWSVPRSAKHLVLALQFNISSAWSAMFVIALVGFFLCVYGVTPTFTVSAAAVDDYFIFSYHRVLSYNNVASYNVVILAYPVFVVALLFSHELRRGLGFNKRVAFLDKSCINQMDEIEKARGIDKIAAYLTLSKTILVIYGDEYMKKLWTVYELATMLLANPDCECFVIPIWTPKILLYGGLVVWLHFVVGIFLPLSGYIKFVLMILMIAALFFVCRWWACSRSHINSVAQNFDIRNAACFCEGDRRILQTNVISFMHVNDRVPRQLSDSDTLDAFNEFVSESLTAKFVAAFGKVGFRYTHSLIIMSSFGCAWVDLLAVDISQGASSTRVCADIVRALADFFVMSPIQVAIVSYFASLTVNRSATLSACLLGVTIMCSLLIGTVTPSARIEDPKFNGRLVHAARFLLYVVCAVVVRILYRRPPKRQDRNAGPASEVHEKKKSGKKIIDLDDKRIIDIDAPPAGSATKIIDIDASPSLDKSTGNDGSTVLYVAGEFDFERSTDINGSFGGAQQAQDRAGTAGIQEEAPIYSL